MYYHVQTCTYTHHGHVIFNHLTSVNMGQLFWYFYTDVSQGLISSQRTGASVPVIILMLVFVSSKKILKRTRSLDLHRCQAGCG